MKLTGTISPTKKILRHLESFKEAPDLVEKALAKAALEIHGNARRNIQEVSPGERQVRYGGGKGRRIVTVSKPGDPPNTDSGRAIKSVLIFRNASNNIDIGTKLRYLVGLEFRSKNRASRPWLSPAFRDFMKSSFGKLFKIKLPKKGGG